MDTRLTELLGTQYPIILAPMAGISTAELTSAACNAGALGSIPVGARDPDGARADIEAVRSATNRPFNVNLFVHQPPARDTAKESAWLQTLEPLFQELGASPPSALGVPYQTLAGNDAMLRLLCELRPAVVSVHFGLPERTVIQTLKGLGIVLMASATPAAEAEAIEAAGIDIVIAQGYEAGGHRGTFNPSFDEGQIGTFALVRQVAGAVRIPVVAAGGIADGRGIAAALALGAAGVQIGTAFISCPESAANTTFRALLQGPRAAKTEVTATISGRPARALSNRLMRELRHHHDTIPDYPVAYGASKALAAAGAAAGTDEFTAMMCGQGAPLSRSIPAARLIAQLVSETEQAVQALQVPWD